MSPPAEITSTPSAHPGDALPVGKLLNGYKIISVLGRGTFGITYLATEEHLDRMVAVKEYLPQDYATRDEDSTVRPRSDDKSNVFKYGRDSFLKEARTQVKFKHPNIVRVLTFFEQNDTAYIVMEYEEGVSLNDYYAEHPQLSQTDLMNIFTPIIEGLETVHEYGFIHRDIKPGNIYIRADGSPVLLDFGSARDVVTNSTDELTRILTHGYAPYEQENPAWAGQGPWTDIYALGATMYLAIMKFKPESGSRRAAACMSEAEDPFVPAASAEGDYTQSFLKAIDRALAFYPKDRPQSLKDWLPMLLKEDEEPGVVFHTHILSEDRRNSVNAENFQTDIDIVHDTSNDDFTDESKAINPLLWMIPAMLFGFIAIGTGLYLLTASENNSSTVTTEESNPATAAINSTVTKNGVTQSAAVSNTSDDDPEGRREQVVIPGNQTSKKTDEPSMAIQGNQVPQSSLSNDEAKSSKNIPLSDIQFAPDSGIEVDEDQLMISFALEKTLKYYNDYVERRSDGSLVIYLQQKQLYQVDNEIEFSPEGLYLLKRLDYVFRNTHDFKIFITDHANDGHADLRAHGIRDFLVSQGLPLSRVQTVVNSGSNKSGFSGIEIQLFPVLPTQSLKAM